MVFKYKQHDARDDKMPLIHVLTCFTVLPLVMPHLLVNA